MAKKLIPDTTEVCTHPHPFGVSYLKTSKFLEDPKSPRIFCPWCDWDLLMGRDRPDPWFRRDKWKSLREKEKSAIGASISVE